MIRHMLMFKFNEGVETPVREEAVERLRKLGELCPTIGAWTVAENVAQSPTAYDVIEIGDFASEADLAEYKEHPAHADFSQFIRPLATWSLVDCVLTSEQMAAEAAFLSDPMDLKEIMEIPAFTLLFRGAEVRSQRGNAQYQQLRDSLRPLFGDDVSPSKVGRIVTTLVNGRLPDGMFERIPGVGLTYKEPIRNKESLNLLSEAVGDVTARRMLRLFAKLTEQD